ncbi:cytochrome c peroxidase [Bradyrhizobium sp. CIAT3101]|uniref:cytochrome-c peroxidase n=1 Tax=Bradyrhizobium sp. CIAT3101 TaxID=439387 RepID=UPI0024B0D27A|nr:cytochrome c peroxidase [Bradyrhizobium sp. CIAT3101]WFU82331.1 cytochrome c peroxidase [Bradyrhizobium sp. CIAT3101]
MRIEHWVFAAVIVLAASTVGPAQTSAEMSRSQARRQAEQLGALGQALFFDPSLSGSGKLSCSSCHDPAHAFGPANDRAVQLGGGDMQQPGARAVPSLKYLQVVPSFTEHFHDSEDEADESIDNGPTGGLTWDGRVDRGADQARIPLLSDFEMGNRDETEVARRVLAAGHGKAIAAIAGAKAVANPAAVYKTALKALEVYQQDHRTFYPYSSKYDAVLAGKAELTAQEARGLELFNAPDKGNCASCHISKRGNDGTPPQFTDYGLIALGIPRNRDIPANKDPGYFDLGLCGPLRTDFLKREDYCGLFRTSTLRNVALRRTFFHNGAVHSLRDAVRFYVERETRPELWYPRKADGSIDKYDDLPDRPKANVNMEPPFDRKAGDAPALNATDIDDVVAFLGTLTDGYEPAK